MKKIARNIVVSILAFQLKRLRNRHEFKVIGIVGSIGKTSTKFAVAQSLGTYKKVRYQEGNYNDLVSVPLVFFGTKLPSLLNPFAWMKIFFDHERMLRSTYPYDVVVVEIGTDGPGQIAAFKKYLQLDIAVLTAITPEHMEFFDDIDSVAKEELSVVQYTNDLILNADLVAQEYQSLVPEALTYGIHSKADITAKNVRFDKQGVKFSLSDGDGVIADISHDSFAEPQVYSLLAAALICLEYNCSPTNLRTSIAAVQSAPGRLNKLKGVKNSTIIDDTYNASPEAVKFALDMVYRIKAPQKIVLLGSMNELGASSEAAHKEVAAYCKPSEISELITLGPDANTFIAPIAREHGCKVTAFRTPYEAGKYMKTIIKESALVLAKGSQNKVYAEEAVKLLLTDPNDASKLVRQSPEWLEIKSRNFA